MSKNKKFEKQFRNEEVVEEVIETPVEEEVVETPIEEVEEIIEQPTEEIVEEVVEETIEEPVEEEEINLAVIGKVIDCKLLNVRTQPDKNSEIVTILPIDSEIIISDVNASPDFYKVLIGDLEGFCMKKFIKIKE